MIKDIAKVILKLLNSWHERELFSSGLSGTNNVFIENLNASRLIIFMLTHKPAGIHLIKCCWNRLGLLVYKCVYAVCGLKVRLQMVYTRMNEERERKTIVYFNGY